MKRRWVLALAAFAAVTVLIAGEGAEPVAGGGEEPEYPHGDFSVDCSSCHQADRWTPIQLDKAWKHPGTFPYRAAHRTTPCRSCHLVLDFTRVPTACADCHRDPHLGELGNDCSQCHTPTNFLDRSAQIDKHRATRFPLIGAHVSQECESCHKPQPQGALKWVGTSTECQACHLALYEATTDPGHVLAGFPTTCQNCHTPTAWDRARFDHAGTGFPLTGAHRTVECSQCHASGYAGTPTDCYSCHRSDYEGTTDPNHLAVGFPTDCALCHNTSSFGGATFTAHDARFPIYSGTHNGRWDQCSDCHTTPGNFTTFSCFLCHSEAETSPRHQEVSGYSYDSLECYRCHPQGRN